MTSYENIARIAYANDDELKLHKAISAGKAIDNSLKKEYGIGGGTKCHFMTENYLKYFTYEALGKRNLLLNN